jgi:hypothetical protein
VRRPKSALQPIQSATTSCTTLSNSSKSHLYLRVPRLISPSAQNVGVIFKTERDSFRVLDQNGQVRLVQPHQISMRRDSNRAIAMDSESHELRVGDNVKEVEGEVRSSDFVVGSTNCNFRHGKVASCICTNHSSPSCITEIIRKTEVSSLLEHDHLHRKFRRVLPSSPAWIRLR